MPLASSMSISTMDFAARLRAADLRVTKPRLAILDVLARRSLPATIEEVHAALRLDDCDLVTVYRSMDAFESIGLVRRLFARNGTTAFVLAGDETTLFVATDAGFTPVNVGSRAQDLRTATAVIEHHLEKLGYRDVVTLIEFFGDPAGKR